MEGRLRSSLCVLLVDDHTETAEMLQVLLMRRGFVVMTACSIATALAAVDAWPIDVLVADISLPDGSGNDLLRQLRAASELKAIALSGLDRASDIRRSREAGFDEHLSKPVAIDELVGALERVRKGEGTWIE